MWLNLFINYNIFLKKIFMYVYILCIPTKLLNLFLLLFNLFSIKILQFNVSSISV